LLPTGTRTQQLWACLSPHYDSMPNWALLSLDSIALSLAYHCDPTFNWTLLPPGPNIFGLFINQDPTIWVMPKAEPDALGPTDRPGPAALGESLSFKI